MIENDNLLHHNAHLEDSLVQCRMQHADIVNAHHQQTSQFQRVMGHVGHVDGVLGEIIRQVVYTQKNVNSNFNKEENNYIEKLLDITAQNHQSLSNSMSTIHSSNSNSNSNPNSNSNSNNDNNNNNYVFMMSPYIEDEIENCSRLGILCRSVYALIQQYKSIESKNSQYDALLKRASQKLNKVNKIHDKEIQGYQQVIEKMKGDHRLELHTLSASKRVLERSIETSNSELRHLVTDILNDSTD